MFNNLCKMNSGHLGNQTKGKMQNTKCKCKTLAHLNTLATTDVPGPRKSRLRPLRQKNQGFWKNTITCIVYLIFLLLKIIVFLLLWIQRYDKNNFFTTLPPTSDSILCSVCCVHWWREALLSDLSISSKTFLLDLFICLNGILDFRPEFNDFRPGPLFPVQQQVSRWVGRRPD